MARKPNLDEQTLQIAKRILSMPPKQHKDMKLGKRKETPPKDSTPKRKPDNEPRLA